MRLFLPVPCEHCGRLGSRFCAGCTPQRARLSPGAPELFALDAYDAPLGQAVRMAKVRPDPLLARALATQSASALLAATSHLPIEAWVPVPSHPRNLLKRGFSAATLLAHALALASGKPVLPLLQAPQGQKQAKLNAAQRRQRQRVFPVRPHGPLRCVGVVDDVVTTGATLRDARTALLKAGIPHLPALAWVYVPAHPGAPVP